MKLISEELELKQNNEDGAIRFDFGKNRVDLLPYDALEKIAEVFTHGAIKYDDENWRNGMSWKRIYGSLFRHLFKAFRGEDIDPDSGCLHLSMAGWGCIVLIHYLKEGLGTDDRIKDIKDDDFKCSNNIIKQEIMFQEINSKLLNKKINNKIPSIKVNDITEINDDKLMDQILDKVSVVELNCLIKTIVKDTLERVGGL